MKQLLDWSKWIPFYVGLVSRYSYDMLILSFCSMHVRCSGVNACLMAILLDSSKACRLKVYTE